MASTGATAAPGDLDDATLLAVVRMTDAALLLQHELGGGLAKVSRRARRTPPQPSRAPSPTSPA